MSDVVHSELWHFRTIQSMCFDCSAGSGSWSKWITQFPFFSLPVYWWNSFTSEANSSLTPPPLHTHTPHPQRSSLKDSHCQSIPPTPPCYTYKVNMYRRCIEKVVTVSLLCIIMHENKGSCLFWFFISGLYYYTDQVVHVDILYMFVCICAPHNVIIKLDSLLSFQFEDLNKKYNVISSNYLWSLFVFCYARLSRHEYPLATICQHLSPYSTQRFVVISCRWFGLLFTPDKLGCRLLGQDPRPTVVCSMLESEWMLRSLKLTQ